MEISLLSDTVTVAAKKGLGFRPIANSSVSLFDPLSSDPAAALQISSPIFDALAPPPVKPGQGRLRRAGVRKKSRTRRSCDGDGEDYFGDGDGFSGGSWGGGGSGGSGGKGWNSDRSEEQNWDESSSSSLKSAFAFIYEVIYWIAFSYCMHFAFKQTVRILADWVAEEERGRFL